MPSRPRKRSIVSARTRVPRSIISTKFVRCSSQAENQSSQPSIIASSPARPAQLLSGCAAGPTNSTSGSNNSSSSASAGCAWRASWSPGSWLNSARTRFTVSVCALMTGSQGDYPFGRTDQRVKGGSTRMAVAAELQDRTDEQRAITEMVRQFVDEQIIPKAEHYDHED